MTSAKPKLLNKTSLPENQVFIIERVNEALNVSKENDGTLILEGICAVFGQRNENNRIYEKQEYLPHLNYLNEKINKGQLFGELDHPQNFDVSLKNVSHVVQGLKFDEPSNTVRIKLKVLDTPCGRIAKTLVESGCTISTSSRAAGQVMEGGKVKLHKIFTYDLVAEPGFSQAALSQVSESLGSNYSMHTRLHAGYGLELSETVTLIPATLIQVVKGAPLMIQIQSQVAYNQRVKLGFGYRNQDAVLAFFGLKVSNKFSMNYCYEYGISPISKSLVGSHELGLSFSVIKHDLVKSEKVYLVE